jgi:hypothetical protein
VDFAWFYVRAEARTLQRAEQAAEKLGFWAQLEDVANPRLKRPLFLLALCGG